MNKIIKTKEKFDRKQNNKIRKWWRKNNYKIYRVILFPIWIVITLLEKHDNKQYEQLKYSPEVCKKYLDKVMPFMVAKYCENAKEILISDADDMGDIEFGDFCGDKLRKKYKNIYQFFSKFHRSFKEYVFTEYQIEGYEKMTMTNWIEWERAKNKFDWGNGPYNSDYVKGVVFYIE